MHCTPKADLCELYWQSGCTDLRSGISASACVHLAVWAPALRQQHSLFMRRSILHNDSKAARIFLHDGDFGDSDSAINVPTQNRRPACSSPAHRCGEIVVLLHPTPNCSPRSFSANGCRDSSSKHKMCLSPAVDPSFSVAFAQPHTQPSIC